MKKEGKESLMTALQREWIMKNKCKMILLIRNIINMMWINNKLWIYMERMTITIMLMNNNLQIKITLIIMMNLKISLFHSMNSLMKINIKINRNIGNNDMFMWYY